MVEYTIDKLADGQVRVSNELRKQDVFVPPDGVGSVWLRHDLAYFTQCLKALEAKLAEDGLILTGYHKHWNVRNTMTRAAVKSIRAHKRRSMSVHSKLLCGSINKPAWTPVHKLYTTKPPITAADLLNDRVLGFYA